MNYEQIQYAVEERIATVTLNRPVKLNAWTTQMGDEVRDAMTRAGQDDNVRAIVLTGAGRGFCAGADMGVLDALSEKSREQGGQWAFRAFDGRAADAAPEPRFLYMRDIPKPIVCAINGPVAGIGLVLTLYCDIRVASDAAFFVTAFSQRAAPAEHGSAWLLPRLIGPGAAMDLLFSSRRVLADEALRLGLVSQVFPESEFHGQVRQYASLLDDRASPLSLRKMKQEVWAALEQSIEESLAQFENDIAECLGSEDFREGVAHFVEKRAPAFTGR